MTVSRRVCGTRLLAASSLLCATLALGQDVPSTSPPAPALAPSTSPPAPPAASTDVAVPPSAAAATPAGRAEATATTATPIPEPAPKLTFHGRVMTGFAVDRTHPAGGQLPRDETEQGFFVKQVRVGLDARLDKRVSAAVSFDLDATALRNAYVNVRFRKEAQLRAGQFKRPFSRLANESVGTLPFRSRGLFDKLILQDQQWGDRTLGVMLSGRPTKTLRYRAALMSPAAPGSGVEGADAIARLEYTPVAELSLGAGASHKWTERYANGPNLSMQGITGDVSVRVGAFGASAEVDAAQNPNPPAVTGGIAPRDPWALGLLGYATYDIKLTSTLTLGPVGVIEWMDPDTEYGRDERVRAVLGLVLGYRDSLLRLMPQVEVTRPIGSASARGEVASESYYLLLATEI